MFQSSTVDQAFDKTLHTSLFTLVKEVHIGNTFECAFMRVLSSFQTMLHDEQPRGSGHVVRYRYNDVGESVRHNFKLRFFNGEEWDGKADLYEIAVEDRSTK